MRPQRDRRRRAAGRDRGRGRGDGRAPLTGRPQRLALLALAGSLALAGCGGARPQRAVGVSEGPVVHYLLCEGERVETVRLSTPSGRALWELRAADASGRTTFRVGETPPGFRETVPFRGLAPVTWVSDRAGDPVMRLPRPLPAAGVARGDGEVVTAAAFAAARGDYCGAVRRNRAAAAAVAFAFLVLLGVFGARWLRAKQSRDPYARAWRRQR